MSVAAAIAALRAGDEPRTWSLIVTIFGDLARRPGAEISGRALSAIGARLGVRPEAMRVALHRLRKDGWIEARRAGRLSFYRLSEAARAEAATAAPRIYARHGPENVAWHLLVAGPGQLGPPQAAGYAALGPGCWIGAGPGRDEDGFLRLAGHAGALPGWMGAALMPDELARAYTAFDSALARVETQLAGCDLAALSDPDRAALRVLLVHRWRRLVLRHPCLPDRMFPPGWAGRDARARLSRLLERIGCPAPASLGDAPVQTSA